MASIENEVFVCMDCETTGLDAKDDRIIEVAAVCFTIDETFAEFESLIDPERPIPESSIVFHHITQEMVMNKPTIKEVLPALLELIGDRTIVGHGIEFDIKIVANAAKRHGIPCTILNNPSLDTLRMARLYGGSPVNSLEQLRRHFNIQAEGAHRAMSDVIVNMGVFKHLAKYYRTTKELFNALSKPILFKIMPLGKHKGRQLRDLPNDYLMWAARQDYDNDLLYSLRTEINRRKKGDLFSQAGNPFANL